MRFRNIKTSGSIQVEKDMVVVEDIAIGGDSSVTGDHTTFGDHTTTGTQSVTNLTASGDVTITGALSVSGTITGTASYLENTILDVAADQDGAPELSITLVKIGKQVFADLTFNGRITVAGTEPTITWSSIIPSDYRPNIIIDRPLNVYLSNVLQNAIVTVNALGGVSCQLLGGSWDSTLYVPIPNTISWTTL